MARVKWKKQDQDGLIPNILLVGQIRRWILNGPVFKFTFSSPKEMCWQQSSDYDTYPKGSTEILMNETQERKLMAYLDALEGANEQLVIA